MDTLGVSMPAHTEAHQGPGDTTNIGGTGASSARVCVVGSGPGGLAVAADFADHGHRVLMADQPDFVERLDPVARAGGVRVRSSWHGEHLAPVTVERDLRTAVELAWLVVVAVPAVVHRRLADDIVPVVAPDAIVLFVGDGGGALAASVAQRAHARADVILAETNCLPYVARAAGAGTVSADRKTGGVLLACLEPDLRQKVLAALAGVWPMLQPAASVWETTLINYDAIDIVPVAIANAGQLEGRPGGMLFWSHGATRSVVRLIEAVDAELLDLRIALGHRDRRRYTDFLVEQGLAEPAPSLFEQMRASAIMGSVRPSGDQDALAARIRQDVAGTFVLASEIGAVLGVPTPVIDATITYAETLLGEPLREHARTLSALGLGDATKADLLAVAGLTGEDPTGRRG